ncbi:hypothetical protein ACJX0J_016108, partial [Zea mays]
MSPEQNVMSQHVAIFYTIMLHISSLQGDLHFDGLPYIAGVTPPFSFNFYVVYYSKYVGDEKLLEEVVSKFETFLQPVNITLLNFKSIFSQILVLILYPNMVDVCFIDNWKKNR